MDINPDDYPENWDGEGAKPITRDVVEFASALEALFATPPEYAPGADGSICFEWVDFKSQRKVFIDVLSDEITIYARVGEKRLKPVVHA